MGCSNAPIARNTAAQLGNNNFLKLPAPIYCQLLTFEDLQNKNNYETPYICYYNVDWETSHLNNIDEIKIALSNGDIDDDLMPAPLMQNRNKNKFSVYSNRDLTDEIIGLVTTNAD